MGTALLELPDARALSDVLGTLLVRRVRVRPREEPADFDGPSVVGEYRTDDGEHAVLCRTTLLLASLAGAGLSLMPAAAASASARSGNPHAGLMDAFHEVLNVAVRILNVPANPHLRLTELHLRPAAFPPEIAQALVSPSRRVDFDVEIEGYGSGPLAFLAA